MFVIKDKSNEYYFHKKGKIILFEDPQIAANFAMAFIDYATKRMMAENPVNIFEVLKKQSQLQVMPADFDISTTETVNFSELM